MCNYTFVYIYEILDNFGKNTDEDYFKLIRFLGIEIVEQGVIKIEKGFLFYSEKTGLSIVDTNEVGTGYKMLSTLVNGFIEYITYIKGFKERNIGLVVNEEGKIRNLEPSMIIANSYCDIVDMVAGDVVFVKTDNNGNTIPLDSDDISFVKSYVASNTIKVGSRVMVLLKV